MSILQGGPGLPMLHPTVNQYMITGKYTKVSASAVVRAAHNSTSKGAYSYIL